MTGQGHIAALKAAADPQRVAASLGLRGRKRRMRLLQDNKIVGTGK
jgi:hypothetical protein